MIHHSFFNTRKYTSHNECEENVTDEWVKSMYDWMKCYLLNVLWPASALALAPADADAACLLTWHTSPADATSLSS